MKLSNPERRKLRKTNEMLQTLCNKYYAEGDAGMSSKFSRAMAIIIDILNEDLKTGEAYDD